ncbi:MAG: cytochrome P450, partial [Caldilineae bacterium]
RGQQLFPIQEKLPSRTNRRFEEGVKAIDEVIYRLIRDRRRAGQYGDDLLGKLLQARDDQTGAGMDDKQLRDELVTLFLAGHETTAIALTWSLGLLSRHPDVRRKLQAEVDLVLGRRTPTAADYEKLVYTQAVFQEVMRLYPPLPVFLREAVGPDELGGYPVPPGAGIMVNVYGVHHHERYWDNPEGFDPERFLPGRVDKRPRYAYIPFGGGPRQCIGNNFALMEGVLALAMIHQRYALDLVPGVRLTPDVTGTLRPQGGVRMVVKTR